MLKIRYTAGAKRPGDNMLPGRFFAFFALPIKEKITMSNLNLNYYYGNEAEQYSFYRIPKALSTDPNYKGLSLEAKFLYGLLLDRMSLSVQSGWMDGDGRVYIYYKLEEVMEQIDCGKDKALRLLRELDEIGLIERRRQGLGRPARIYVKNFVLPERSGQTPEERSGAPSKPPARSHAQTEPLTFPSGGRSSAWSAKKQKSRLRKIRPPEFGKPEVRTSIFQKP